MAGKPYSVGEDVIVLEAAVCAGIRRSRGLQGGVKQEREKLREEYDKRTKGAGLWYERSDLSLMCRVRRLMQWGRAQWGSRRDQRGIPRKCRSGPQNFGNEEQKKRRRELLEIIFDENGGECENEQHDRAEDLGPLNTQRRRNQARLSSLRSSAYGALPDRLDAFSSVEDHEPTSPANLSSERANKSSRSALLRLISSGEVGNPLHEEANTLYTEKGRLVCRQALHGIRKRRFPGSEVPNTHNSPHRYEAARGNKDKKTSRTENRDSGKDRDGRNAKRNRITLEQEPVSASGGALGLNMLFLENLKTARALSDKKQESMAMMNENFMRYGEDLNRQMESVGQHSESLLRMIEEQTKYKRER